jgi:CBS-domain-containing membrane protein
MTISEICNREVVIAERGLCVEEAARLMRLYHVGDIVIVEDKQDRRRPLGIVTDRDIMLEVVAAGVSPGTLTVGDIMGQGLAVVGEDQGVFETLRYMRGKGVRRMPVVDKEGWLVGIVTLDDLMEVLAEEMGELARLVRQERHREESVRTPSV